VGVHKHTSPVPGTGDKWLQDIETAQVWRLARDYLQFLGQDLVTEMGYSYERLSRAVEKRRPTIFRTLLTYPLWLLVDGLNWSERCHTMERDLDRVLLSLQQSGLGVTASKIAQELRRCKSSP
jgi:hypothetical protein